ncbi:hypothetical protein Krac_7006 [Ktedonobacter racemifer DSM 44963]|uniref:Response regulatory domain-containing protein n=1 Tax=Ktedonobacter racemifer DSM 44963 TaxID=485913 RepID=D6TQC0_KTERA|nr:hypothetical protein Krac_7006 [Ktedonobacter racemifer DSM 44963]
MLQPREKVSHSAAKAVLVVEDDTDIGAFLVEAVREETSYSISGKSNTESVHTANKSSPNLPAGIATISFGDPKAAATDMQTVSCFTQTVTEPFTARVYL